MAENSSASAPQSASCRCRSSFSLRLIFLVASKHAAPKLFSQRLAQRGVVVDPAIEENSEDKHLFVAFVARLHFIDGDVTLAIIGTSHRDVSAATSLRLNQSFDNLALFTMATSAALNWFLGHCHRAYFLGFLD
jgi:hypothetical protein